MCWDEIIKSVKWIIMKSNTKIENIDWFEVIKYLAIMMTNEEIDVKGWQQAVS